MKRIIMFVLLFAALKVAGQTTGYLRFDTVKIMKQNGFCELYLINKTKDSLGLLTNVGGGLTQFRRSKMLNDSTIIVGLDTLLVRGTGGGGITQLTGDVTAGPGSGSQAATIATNAVTNAKLAQAAALTVKGNPTNATANVQDITAATAGTYLKRTGTTLGFDSADYVDLKNIPTSFTDTLAFPPISGMVALGDSYLDNALYTYMDNIASQFNITYNNLAVSGAQVRSQIKELYTNTTTTPTVPLMLSVGFNNFRGRTDSLKRIETVKAGYRSIIANQFAKTFEPPFGPGGTANPKYTFSASTAGAAATSEDSLTDWGSHVYWVRHNVAGWGGANWWKKASISANETITIDSLLGSNLYIQTWACDNAHTVMSRIQYAVDGTTLGTYDPRGKSWSTTEAGLIRFGIINDAIVITGLRDTLHRMVLTFLDGGVMGGIDGVGVLLSPNVSIRQPAFIPALPHMNATGYAFVPPPDGATEQSLDSATAILKAELQSVFAGYPLYFPNENAPGYYDPLDPEQINADGIHPTGAGHYQFYRAILAEISPQKMNVVSSGSGTDDLDDVTTRGASTANKITITGNSSTESKLAVGAFEFQPFSADNGLITRNIYFDGSTFRWRSAGYGSMMHMVNGSLAFRVFGSGSAGADAVSTLATPFVVSQSSHIGLGGNMTFDDNMTGATMHVLSTNKVNLPQAGAELNVVNGTLNVGQSANAGNGTVEVTGTGYFQRNANNSTYVVVKNGTNNTAAQADYIAYNDNNDLVQIGVKSTGLTPAGTMAAGAAYLRSSGTTGLVIQADNGPIKYSRTGSNTEFARWSAGALLINRTSAVGSELLSVNGKINANADSVGTATGGYVFRDAATGELKITGAPSGGTTLYSGDGTLAGNRVVTGNNLSLTYDDILAYRINSDYNIIAKANGTAPYSEAIIGTPNAYWIGYTPTGGVYSKGPGVVIDTNNNVGLGTQPPTTMPLYATGSSTFIQGLQSNAANFYKVENHTTDFTVNLSGYFHTIDATAGNVTVTLPAASTAFGNTMGITYKFQRIDNSGNTVTIQRAGSDTINGGTSFTITTQWTEVRQVQCTSTSTWAQWQ